MDVHAHLSKECLVVDVDRRSVLESMVYFDMDDIQQIKGTCFF
jgi:hypothetical protein